MKSSIIFPYQIEEDIESRLEESIGLARAIDLEVVYSTAVKLRDIRPATYVGKGFLENLKKIIEEKEIELVIFDTNLSPIQQRNLEKELDIKVIDRTALILEIFGERANTKEGTLQVELAHLTYQRSRLVRSWTHLERQRGGAGFLGGPGETQMELDRRIIDDKIVKIKKELEKVKKTRSLQRTTRKRVPYPIVALVGYTNAGKSTLFNKLSNADVFAQDLLFATLDPTMRRIKLKNGKEIILSDTVGFISNLPHELIMSFRATLEEVLEADIVVHVRNMALEDSQKQRKEVLKVLHDLGLKEIENKDNYIEVLNKIDLLDDVNKKKTIELSKRNKQIIPVSAITGEGCERLLEKINEVLTAQDKTYKITIPATDGKTLSWIHDHADVISSKLKNKSLLLEIKTDEISYAKLEGWLKNL